jgi:RpiR family carbohydrate utilization transcriptional regulator
MLDRIKASPARAAPAEQRVAKLLLADPRSFATLPVASWPTAPHVSKPTVVRFCRSVGYDGLADFKLKLAGSVNEGVPFVHRASTRTTSPATCRQGDRQRVAPAALPQRRQPARLRARHRGAGRGRARAGRRIEFYGVGNSGIVAQDAQHKFFRLGVRSPPRCSDGHVQVMSATMLGPATAW